MITNPTKQRELRGHKALRPTPRMANTAEHQATLAQRLTARDRWIIRMLHEHRVLTAHHITALAFPSFRSGRQRLRELYLWGVVDRFQPFVSVGTAPMHYVLAPAGATVLAAEDGVEVKDLGYRHHRAFGIAHSLRLAHTVGVADWFTALATTDPTGNKTLRAWWSETRCARHFGDLIKPDAYGRWTTDSSEIEFFLEYDFGTEPLTTLATKLTGYGALAQATGITTPVLVWLQTSRRETTARQLLHPTWRQLDNPQVVPVATATAELLDPQAPHPSPAEPVWLPLDHQPGQVNPRRELHRLPEVWPHLPAPSTDSASGGDPVLALDSPRPLLGPAPAPLPPATLRGPDTGRR
jgi:hypothetical protein